MSEKIDEAEAQRLLDVNLGYEPAQPGDDKHHTAEPEEAAADTLARVEARRSPRRSDLIVFEAPVVSLCDAPGLS